MRSAPTFWRYHAKPRVTHTRPVVVRPAAAPGSVAYVRQLMQQAKDAADAAGYPRPWYPFEAADVVTIYTSKKDEGEGLWFGLFDGRIFAATGEPSSSDPTAYEASA